MNKQKRHKISGLDSDFGGSMFMKPGESIQNVLDSRNRIDTYMERAVIEIEQYAGNTGSAILAIAEFSVAS